VSASPTDRFRRVDAVFDAVLDLPTADQTAFIDRACGDDSELRAEVIRLLNAYRRAEFFLESPAVEIAAPLLEEAHVLATAAPPERIGPFRVVRAIGHGGMGQVFLGERADGQFEQRVALKLIQHGAAGLVRRFLEERRILALLEHPNIARLIDGGITADGLPYFAMELVEGEPIDRYCDTRGLSIERRLELFNAVCDGVTYAHQHLVVHRDLKPSNIFVTPNGQVKLLDFGIAKLIGAESSGDDLTRTGFHVMTPEFAAPEQVRGEAISTVTDVYALGVLLYNLLTGVRPYDVRGKSPAEVERIICGAGPLKPSASFDRGRGDAGPRAQARAGAPDRLGRLLHGDLDAIVLKALRKEPARRYDSVASLQADLNRFRAAQPVLARPNSALYRLRKFSRRNRAAVAASLVTLTALISATAFSTGQMREAQHQRDSALQEVKRQRMLVEIQNVLAGDARGADGRQLSSVERIALAEGLLSQQFRNEPQLLADGLTGLAERLYEIGDREAERRTLLRARAVAQAANLHTELAIADCKQVYSLVYDDQLDSARTFLSEAQGALARLGARSDLATAVCYTGEAQLLVAENQLDSALVLLTRATNITQAGGAEPIRMQIKNDLASGLRVNGRTRAATEHQRENLVELEAKGYLGTDILPNAASFLISALNELGEVSAMDSIAGALIHHQAAQGQYSSGVLFLLHGFAKLRLGELDTADLLFTRAMRDTTEGAGNLPRFLAPNITQLRLEQGRLAEARSSLKDLPTGTFVRRVHQSWLSARILHAEGDIRGARSMLEDSLRALNGDEPKPKPALAVLFVTAAEWRLAAGDARGADSLALLARAAAAVDSLALQRSAWAGRAELVHARALLELGERQAARLAADRAVVALSNGFGPASAHTRAARALRASILN
jgi:serine/threonine-protein kinase